jgi:hypothetical protein
MYSANKNINLIVPWQNIFFLHPIWMVPKSNEVIYNYHLILKASPGQNNIKIGGVIYVSDIQPRVVANFVEEFFIQQNVKVYDCLVYHSVRVYSLIDNRYPQKKKYII